MMQSTLQQKISEEGFAVVPRLFSPGQLDKLFAEIEQHAPRRTRAGIRHALSLAPVAALAHEPQLIELAREVLGPQAFPYRATLFEKSPQSNWLVVWHQDTALPLRLRHEAPGWGPWSVKEGVTHAHAPASALNQILALRVHLDDSTTSNGPLRVLPGTHALGVLSDDTVHDLAARIAHVDCIVSKGGILAMRPLLVHASSKSHTDLPRRVLHIEYAASTSVADPFELAIAY